MSSSRVAARDAMFLSVSESDDSSEELVALRPTMSARHVSGVLGLVLVFVGTSHFCGKAARSQHLFASSAVSDPSQKIMLTVAAPTGAQPTKSFGPIDPITNTTYASVMTCVGNGDKRHSFKSRLVNCAQDLLGSGINAFGHVFVDDHVGRYEEKLSWDVARPLYSVPMAKAYSALSQASQCGPEDFVRDWTCPACKEAGFQLVPGTHRFVHYEELGRANATFIIVARVNGSIPHPVTLRDAQPLQHHGDSCWNFCGRTGGFCSWCGVGNACCGNGDSNDPLECKGVFHDYSFHTCVAASADRTPRALAHKGEDCFSACGKVSGPCNFCGAGNLCCRKGVDDARECRGALGFTTDQHHECVAPAFPLPVPPTTASDLGCVVVVRGSHNAQNGISSAEFMLRSLPFQQCEGCEVHAGFDDVWRNVHSKVVQNLGSLGCVPGSTRSRILLTGESLGGAVATLGQYYLQATGFTLETQYNFGSPRVGNSKWAQHFNAFFGRSVPLFRVTHAHDVVSRLPPVSLLDYTHVSAEVFYPAEDPNSYVVCLGGEDFECQNRYDLAECLASELQWYAPHGSLESTPGEAFDVDHCHSGLAPDNDLCQCSLSSEWLVYRSTEVAKHRWDSAPNNALAPRLVPGVIIG